MAPTPSGHSRVAVFDRMRGLIMVLMAIDHAAFFILRRHPVESWAFPPPWYPSAPLFLTRAVTHLCAPGFFMLMGAGMAWFAESRAAAGWTPARIRRVLVTRGLLLLVIQHVVENPAWLMGMLSAGPGAPPSSPVPGDPADVFLGFAVITALGVSMIFWSTLTSARSSLVLTISLAMLALSVVMTPTTADAAGRFSIVTRLLFVPGQTSFVAVLYPVVAWLAPTGFGILLARAVGRDVSNTSVPMAVAGAASIALFVALRAADLGDPHPPAEGVIGFLSLTKYPPSIDFLALMIGIDLILIVLLGARVVAGFSRPLEVIGRVPLFFYLLHLYVFSAWSWLFPSGSTLPVMYAIWAVSVLAMYPACVAYGRFRAGTPTGSLWRTF